MGISRQRQNGPSGRAQDCVEAHPEARPADRPAVARPSPHTRIMAGGNWLISTSHRQEPGAFQPAGYAGLRSLEPGPRARVSNAGPAGDAACGRRYSVARETLIKFSLSTASKDRVVPA